MSEPRVPVTTDWDVCRAMLDIKKRLGAKQVGQLLNLTPFQITARLKGMEKRGRVDRDQSGLWALTPDGRAVGAGEKPPEPLRRPRAEGGGAAGRPDDSGLPTYKGMKGSKLRYIFHGKIKYPLHGTQSKSRGTGIPVFTSIKGQEFIEASTMENATRRSRGQTSGLVTRLRPFEGSSLQLEEMRTLTRLQERENYVAPDE